MRHVRPMDLFPRDRHNYRVVKRPIPPFDDGLIVFVGAERPQKRERIVVLIRMLV